MDSSFVQWLTTQVGTAGLAGLALYLLDRSYRDSLRREKETAEQGREDRRQLITVLGDNAKMCASLQSAVEALTREFGRSPRRDERSGND